MKDAIVSFEKSGKGVKVVKKTRRISVPGIIEQQEMLRADQIEADLYIRCLVDRHAWYNQKGE